MLYVSPISDELNVRFVENHIVIDRPSDKIFDWVTTPKNMTQWFPQMLGWEVLTGGPADKPQNVGDSIMETIVPAIPGGPPRRNLYTVVALVPGFQWVATAQRIQADGQPAPNIMAVAVWTVKPLSANQSLFVRLFEAIRPDLRNAPPETFDPTSVPRKGTVIDPEVIQPGLVRLKQLVEQAIPEN
jgi:hypothetical protein